MKDLRNGHFVKELHNLTLIKKDRQRKLGEGRLKWECAKELIIETSVMKSDYKNFNKDMHKIFHLNAPPGKLATEKEMCELTCIIEGGNLEIKVLPRIKRISSYMLDLSFQPTETVKIRQPTPKLDVNQLYGVLEGINYRLLPWDKKSTVRDNNPLFGRTKSDLDWFQTTINDIKIAIRKANENHARLAIVDLAKQDNPLEKWAQAFVKALSFVSGKKIHLIGYEYRSQNFELFALNRSSIQRRIKGKFYSPFDSSLSLKSPNNILDLVKNITTKIMRSIDKYGHLMDMLGICHEASDSYVQVKLLVSTIVLEGMLKHYLSSFSNFPTYQDKHKDQICKLKRYVTKEKDFTDDFRKRMGGLLGSIQNPRVEDLFETIKEKKLLPIWDNEIDAWRKARHPYAHGSFKPLKKTRDFQEALQNLDCIANLINKLILNVFDYHGPYVDYATPGYRKKKIE